LAGREAIGAILNSTAQISITLDGTVTEVESTATGFTLFSDKSICALRVNGELKDLAHTVAKADIVEGVSIDSEDGLNILRHSTAHVLAQAVQNINPEAKLGIGPPIKDGFYYDFDVANPFTLEDLKVLEKEMDRIIRSGQRFVRRVTNEVDAAIELAAEPYKLELIGLKSGNADVGEAAAEVGAGELTIYDNYDVKADQVVWKDLCRGPHLPNTRMVGNGYAVTRVAAAYWRGNENNKQLQRFYGTAWPSKEQLKEHDADDIAERLLETLHEFKEDITKMDFKIDVDKLKSDIKSSSKKIF
jgi:threonyl-tRNA synthetase